MWIRNFRRFIAEAFSGLIKNGLMTVASIIVVTSCLFIFGVFIVVTMNINNIGEQISNSCQIQAYIQNDAKPQEVSDQIKKIKHIDNVEYETGEETFKNFKKGLTESEAAAFNGLPDNTISNSFKVTLDDLTYAEEVAKQLEKINGVEHVENRQDIVNIVNKATQLIRRVSFWIVIVFLLISMFIISNTVKLAVHNRRREINIMKYVGATDSYIRWPFIIEGVFVGLISAAIAFAATDSGYMAIVNAMNGGMKSVSMTVKVLGFGDIWQVVVCAYIILGVSIGAIGSAFSVRRYLKV